MHRFFCRRRLSVNAKNYPYDQEEGRRYVSARRGEGLDETVTDGKGGGGGPILTASFVEDMRKMVGDGFLAESQLLGDLRVGEPFCYQAQHLYLSCGQSSERGRG